jgi:hypothetical protein
LNAVGLISLSSITACPGANAAGRGAAGPDLIHVATPAVTKAVAPIAASF